MWWNKLALWWLGLWEERKETKRKSIYQMQLCAICSHLLISLVFTAPCCGNVANSSLISWKNQVSMRASNLSQVAQRVCGRAETQTYVCLIPTSMPFLPYDSNTSNIFKITCSSHLILFCFLTSTYLLWTFSPKHHFHSV